MRAKIFTFVAPSERSKATGHDIARFLSDVTGVEMTHGPDVVEGKAPLDVLFIMSGAASFCNCREALAVAILDARHVVWVQDDYSCEPTPIGSAAESPYRKAFIMRQISEKPIHYWTTVRKNADRTPGSAYVPWNMLGYVPHRLPTREPENALVYYGVWRRGRRRAFERYFSNPIARTVISTKPGNEFSREFPKCEFAPIQSRPELPGFLREFRAGLYIEDEKSSGEFHSPARRFYEMLGAGVAMLFDQGTVPMLLQSEINVEPYVVRNASEVATGLGWWKATRRDQAELWRRDYYAEVADAAHGAWKKIRGLL